jgi:hypothetical protein
VAWLEQRANPDSLFSGLAQARYQLVREALPVARRTAANTRLPRKCRAGALPILGLFGGREDERLISGFLDDKTPHSEHYQHDRRTTTTQIRDVALGALLALRGRSPGDFGFPTPEKGPYREASRWLYCAPHYLWFVDDAAREAAHEKAKKWLGLSAKPAG